MKKVSRIFYVILAVCLMMGILTSPFMVTHADTGEEETESDLFTYKILDDGTASITSCSATGDIVIPSQIDGYTVTNLQAYLFRYADEIYSVKIPATVTSFGSEETGAGEQACCFSFCYCLQNIYVDDANPAFMSDDGILYDKNQEILFQFPCKKRLSSYHVPKTVRVLADMSFAYVQYLQRLYLDGKDTTWYAETFNLTRDVRVMYQPGGKAQQNVEADQAADRTGKNNYAAFVLTDAEYLPDAVYRSQDEIRTFAKEHPFKDDSVTYQKEPNVKAPYRAGRLSDDTLTTALNFVNFFRFTAGLDADVTLNEEYISKAQAGTLVNEVNGVMNHYPEKPADMDESLYELGYAGASSSCLGGGFADLIGSIFIGWMSDSDSTNIEHVGHRRFILNPSMKETGFGVTGAETAMYAHDSGRESGPKIIVWPAQNMPVEYFPARYPWTITMGVYVNPMKVQVQLVREKDGKKWIFSQQQADGYFNVSNDNYGQIGCIIFRPDEVGSYANQDCFEVTVSLNGEIVLQYHVDFFNMVPGTDHPFNDVGDPDDWYYETVYGIASTVNKKGHALMSGYANGSGNFGPTDSLTRQDFAVILYRLAEEPDVIITKNPFPDADPKGYYYKAIVWAQQEGVITGYNDGKFGVGDNITREQVATILYRYAKSTGMDISANGDLNKFKDFKSVSPFAIDALKWANGAKIITGKAEGTLIDPQGNAARAEIAKMILVFMENNGLK